MKNKLFILFMGCFILSLTACDRYDADKVSLNVEVSNNKIKVGEVIDFTIYHENVEKLVVFTGDEGHEYLKSSDYLLSGVSSSEIVDSIYREPNPLVRKFSLDFTKLAAIPSVVEYPDMELVDDEKKPEGKVLKLKLYPKDWGKVLKIYSRVGLGIDNQDFTIRLRFDSNDLFKKENGEWVPGSIKKNFRIVTEVIGKTADGEVLTVFNQGAPNSLWYGNVITPSDVYFNHIVNLSKWMVNWEKANGKKMQTVEYISLKFVGDDAAAFKGDIFVTSITLGVDGYYDFATGTNIQLLNGDGKAKFSYSFSKPGKYDVTFIGVGNSMKNYEGDGYQSNRNDISGENYKYGKDIITIPINVE